MARVSSSGSAQDAALVRLAQRGDEAAFDRLVRHYRGILMAAACARTRDREAAQDLVQDVLIKAWRKLPTLNNPESFPAWLKAITINACLNWRRARPPAEHSAEVGPAETMAASRCNAVDEFLARDEWDAWGQALRAIPERNRLPFVLHVLGAYTYGEIAGLLGVSLTTIVGRIHRASMQLRRVITDREVAQHDERRK